MLKIKDHAQIKFVPKKLAIVITDLKKAKSRI